MNQLTVNNSNPSKLYVGEGEGTSAFLSGQIVFPSVSGSVTFAGNAIPADQDLSADDTSVNLSVVFSYDTRNSLAVVLQKEDSSGVMQDVETVSVTDTRFSGWDSINAAVNVSQDVPIDEHSNTYQFKFTETVDGTDVTTLSSLMIVRRKPELTVTLSPSGDQTIQPGEEITLTPTLTVVGIPASSLSSVNWRWTVRKGDNTYASDLVTDLNDPDYTVDSGTGALTITGNLSKARKHFTLVANVSDESQGASGKLYTAHVYVTVNVSESVGGYLPCNPLGQYVWPFTGSPTGSDTKGFHYGFGIPIRQSDREEFSEYFDEFERVYFNRDDSGGYISGLRLREYRTQNQPRVLLQYLLRRPKLNATTRRRSYRSDEEYTLFKVYTLSREGGSVIDSFSLAIRHSEDSMYLDLSAVVDDTKKSLVFGDARYRATQGQYSGGAFGQFTIQDYFYVDTSLRQQWKFFCEYKNSVKDEYQRPTVTKALRVDGNPVKIYAFLQHDWHSGGCQIIATVGEGRDPRYYDRFGDTEEVAFIRPKNDTRQTGSPSYGDRCNNYISDDFNWVFGVWNEAYLWNKSQFWNSPDMTTGVVQARMVKTNFDDPNSDPVLYSSVDIPLDGLPADRFAWGGVSGQFSGDGSTAAVILSLARSASLGGRIVFYSHDGNGVLTYRSTIVFPLAGHSPVKVSLSNNGQLALVTIRESHPNVGKGRTQLYSRSSASSWVWSEEDSPDGVTVEEKRLVNALPTNSKSSIEQYYDLEGTLSADGNAMMTTQGCVLYEYDNEPDVFGRPQFYAVPVVKNTLFLKPKREEEN